MDQDTDDATESPVVINELLMYAVHQRDWSTAASLRSVLDFYTATEIAAAKKQLILSFSQYVCDSNLSTERRSSTQRSASDAETDDILELLEKSEHVDICTVCCGKVR